MFFLCRTEELKILYICLVLIIKINLRQKTSQVKFQWDAQNRSLFQEMFFFTYCEKSSVIHSFVLFLISYNFKVASFPDDRLRDLR